MADTLLALGLIGMVCGAVGYFLPKKPDAENLVFTAAGMRAGQLFGLLVLGGSACGLHSD